MIPNDGSIASSSNHDDQSDSRYISLDSCTSANAASAANANANASDPVSPCNMTLLFRKTAGHVLMRTVLKRRQAETMSIPTERRYCADDIGCLTSRFADVGQVLPLGSVARRFPPRHRDPAGPNGVSRRVSVRQSMASPRRYREVPASASRNRP